MADVVVHVPGVSTILGEFSKYCRGRVLCCANNQNLSIRLSDSSDNQVHVLNTQTGDKKRFSLSNLKYRKEDKWGNYAKGIYSQLTEEGYSPKAFDLVLEGDLLKGDGPTLASAMSVGICLALNKVQGLNLTDSTIGILCYRACTAFCSEDAKFSTIVTMLEAEKGRYLLFDLESLSFVCLDDPFPSEPQCMLTVDCSLPPDAMREEIRHRHMQAAVAFDELTAKTRQFPIRDFPVSELKDRLVPIGEETRRLCAAVLEDSATAAAMQRLFERKDCIQIGKSLGKVGKLLRDDLELSCPEMEWMVKRASEVPACHGSTVLFNGVNTLVLLVMDRSSVPLYMARLEEYEHIFGFKAVVSELIPAGCRQ